eukprot:934412-Prorocentrum_minimum.AAC.2
MQSGAHESGIPTSRAVYQPPESRSRRGSAKQPPSASSNRRGSVVKMHRSSIGSVAGSVASSQVEEEEAMNGEL